nr:hypothetical protein [Tanacetum cinerariifolium]
TNAKSGSVDGGFVATVVGGGVGVDYGGKEVKDGIDCEIMVEYIGEDSMIIKTCTVRSMGVFWLESNSTPLCFSTVIFSFFLDNGILRVSLMTTPHAGALEDFFAGLFTLFDFFTGSLGDTGTV